MTPEEKRQVAAIHKGFLDRMIDHWIEGEEIQAARRVIPRLALLTRAEIPPAGCDPSLAWREYVVKRLRAARFEVERLEAIVDELPPEYWPRFLRVAALYSMATDPSITRI